MMERRHRLCKPSSVSHSTTFLIVLSKTFAIDFELEPVFDVYYTARVAETDVEIVTGHHVKFTRNLEFGPSADYEESSNYDSMFF